LIDRQPTQARYTRLSNIQSCVKITMQLKTTSFTMVRITFPITLPDSYFCEFKLSNIPKVFDVFSNGSLAQFLKVYGAI
jgi:hypothetical protein